MDRQQLLDDLRRYEAEATLAEANARRLRNRIARLQTYIIGTEGEQDRANRAPEGGMRHDYGQYCECSECRHV